MARTIFEVLHPHSRKGESFECTPEQATSMAEVPKGAPMRNPIIVCEDLANDAQPSSERSEPGAYKVCMHACTRYHIKSPSLWRPSLLILHLLQIVAALEVLPVTASDTSVAGGKLPLTKHRIELNSEKGMKGRHVHVSWG